MKLLNWLLFFLSRLGVGISVVFFLWVFVADQSGDVERFHLASTLWGIGSVIVLITIASFFFHWIIERGGKE